MDLSIVTFGEELRDLDFSVIFLEKDVNLFCMKKDIGLILQYGN